MRNILKCNCLLCFVIRHPSEFVPHPGKTSYRNQTVLYGPKYRPFYERTLFSLTWLQVCSPSSSLKAHLYFRSVSPFWDGHPTHSDEAALAVLNRHQIIPMILLLNCTSKYQPLDVLFNDGKYDQESYLNAFWRDAKFVSGFQYIRNDDLFHHLELWYHLWSGMRWE